MSEPTLREALKRVLGNFERVLARKPVRDATETIAEARAALARADDGLDAAWAEAEAALPEGWGIWFVEHVPNDAEGPWVATVGAVPAETPKEMAWAYGPTPTAALTALAEKLEAGR